MNMWCLLGCVMHSYVVLCFAEGWKNGQLTSIVDLDSFGKVRSYSKKSLLQ